MCLLIYFSMNIRKGTPFSFHPKKTTGAVVFWLGWALYDRDIKTLFVWFIRRFAFTRRPYIRRTLCVNFARARALELPRFTPLPFAKLHCEFITLKENFIHSVKFRDSCEKKIRLTRRRVWSSKYFPNKDTLINLLFYLKAQCIVFLNATEECELNKT